MSWPTDGVLPQGTRLYLGGEWVDVTDDVRGDAYTVSISRGRPDEASRTDATRFRATLDNRSGDYSIRNPTGAYYGLLQRNTQLQHYVHYGSPRLVFTAGDVDNARSVDVAALDITGDIDIRAQIRTGIHMLGIEQTIANKFNDIDDQRSWIFNLVPDGRLSFWWTTDGTTGTFNFTYSTLPISNQRDVAVRVTLDVNNGAGGHTVTFYTSDTVGGTWTQLGDPVVETGVTSIFSSTADLYIGGGLPYPETFLLYDYEPFRGEVFAFELRNGIGGAAVANPVFTGLALGTTAFTDAAGRSWTVNGDAEITDRHIRCTVEVPNWPQRWDSTGIDRRVPLEGFGPLARLAAHGGGVLRSPIHRATLRAEPVEYWPMEDASGSTSFASALGGTPLMVASGSGASAAFAADSTITGSAPLPRFEAQSYPAGPVSNPGTPGAWTVSFPIMIPTEPVGRTEIMGWVTSGSVPTWRVTIVPGAPATVVLQAFDVTAVERLTAPTINFSVDGVELWGRPLSVRAYGYDLGTGTMTATLSIYDATDFIDSSTDTMVATAGAVTAIEVTPGQCDAVRVNGHIAVYDVDWASSFWAFTPGPLDAHTGESAGSRFLRICGEEDWQAGVIGEVDDSALMGPQPRATLHNLIRECADAEQGLLFEPRHFFGLGLRLVSSMEHQTSAFELSYVGGHQLVAPVEPDEGTSYLVNDVTVSRVDGSSARAYVSDGPLSILPPPDGVGAYPLPLRYNLFDDDQLTAAANWRLNIGAREEPRWPRLSTQLRRPVMLSIIGDIIGSDLGDRIVITDPPAGVPPEDIPLVVHSYTETFSNFDWVFDWTAGPAEPYDTLISDSATYGRYDTDRTELVAALTSSATSAVVHAVQGPPWLTTALLPADFPLDLNIGGERVTLTACSTIAGSFVGAGTVDHDDNATLTPALHASTTANDLMVMFAAIRSTTATVVTPTGWILVGDFDTHVRVFAKYALAGEATPTVTFTGGVAGDTTSAQVATFRGVALDVLGSSHLVNTSAQDVAVPALSINRGTHLLLRLAWKADDWTSVATISGMTEIGEPDTVTGSDQGIVWDYEFRTPPTPVAATSFVVTGGLAAVSKGAALALACDVQTMTITRSVNGVTKSHPAGVPYSRPRLWQPVVWAK